ncbi:Uracil-DNA glycosylase [Nitrosomonas eutropha]|uniref:Uracil-DNA glycosylase n=1 Tax=Nitrosomonas eutropha TaxID=916 RepID=A0A1I7G117_9PROT|nr:uracil-DNA glycosylase family protein [Nitrosomonas eutropha]SFU42152.1 Uracil-DNA glycosylase [Nitrosomonas eutropha]
MDDFISLIHQVRRCTLCAEHLPLGPKPVFQLHESARILIASQAPGRRVHETGVPFDDPSGNRLREWLGVSREKFYDSRQIAILPMGLCFPGTGKSGDFPPRPECAPAWRSELLSYLKSIRLTLLVGQYAQAYSFAKEKEESGRKPGASLTENIRAWREFWPDVVPLPHPSPRNNLWLKRNPWFMEEVIPALRERVAVILESDS